MKIKKLMPIDAESRRLIDWMEIGVYDALQKKYLKTLLFCISEAIDGPMMEEYAFSFSYSNSDSEEVMMNISHTGNEKQGTTFKSNGNTDITPNQMRSSACKMVRTLVQLMGTLDRMPEEVHNQSIVVKEDMDVQVNQVDEKVQKGTNEDYFYLKARYHVKPRLGKRVIRSELTEKKLVEVKNVLGIKLSAMDISEPQNISTCGGLHSVGSDLTRIREGSVYTHQKGSSRIQELLGNNTPIISKYRIVLTSESIPTVKAKIHFKEGIPPSQQCLFFGSIELTDGTLEEYCITKASTFHILLFLCGGGNRKKKQKKARIILHENQEQEKAERIAPEQVQKPDKKKEKKKQHEENDMVLANWRARWNEKYQSDKRFLEEESLDVKGEIQLQETKVIRNKIMQKENDMVLSNWGTRRDANPFLLGITFRK